MFVVYQKQTCNEKTKYLYGLKYICYHLIFRHSNSTQVIKIEEVSLQTFKGILQN